MSRLQIRRPPQLSRAEAVAAATEIASAQANVVGRRQLAAAGVSRWVIRNEVAVGRWQRTGRQTVAIHNGQLDRGAQCWVAVLEVGRRAALDGVTALQHAGCSALTDDEIHVIVPKGSTPARPAGVVVHESRLYDERAVLTNGIRRTKPAVAAVHAALWAVTDRQATYFLLLAGQNRLARPADIATAVRSVRRHKRGAHVRRVVRDLAGGVQALSEFDVAGHLRRRGLPEPRRQVVRRRPSGTDYLDCEFDGYDITLEIDGIGHDQPLQQLADLLRDIATMTSGKLVIRVPMVAFLLDPDAVLDALTELLTSRGWRAA